ncbi:hypothetical protein JXA47_03970 [Candidatus Sumerlaeota bacterium]|nr:hypothetical protein [Candidatus Sumerlaeota bacterium]
MRLFLICLSITALLMSSAFAVPYASYIRVSDITVQPGDGLDISYILNEDTDSITVELIPDGGGAAVATTTFTSPAAETTSGLHTVSWDGTADFAGGTEVGEGDYRVQITADNAAAAGWAEITSNRSLDQYDEACVLETLFGGFSGKDVLIQFDPDSNLFGVLLISSCYSAPEHSGMIPLRTDLNTFGGGDGLADIVLQHPSGYVGNQGLWGSTFDPTMDDFIWVAGQDDTTTTLLNCDAGALTIPAFMADADAENDLYGAGEYPRGIAILENGGTRYGLVALGSNRIDMFTINTNNQAVGPLQDILETSNVNRYSRDVELDAAGNLYWATRTDDINVGLNGRVYRWDNATVLAAIANPTGAPLTDANATWIVDPPAGAIHLHTVTIAPDGEVYTSIRSSGIYSVGNVSLASNVKTLGPSDLLIDYTAIGVDGWANSTLAAVSADPAGNLYVVETSNESIRCFGPGGTTSETFVGPTSQTITVATVTSVRDWNLYE